MTDEEFVAHIDAVSKAYRGDSSVLFSAIGALMVGRTYGWRVLRIVTSHASYTKYQRILEIDFKEVLPPETKYSERSLGYAIVTKLNNFWEVVRGHAKVDAKEKRKFT